MAENTEFLRETIYCNYSAPAIQELARSLAGECTTERELAVSGFQYARDGLLYELGNWQRTASQSLARGRGSCTNAANLVVALMRACGVPAGFGVLRVRGREYFGPIAPARLTPFVAEVSVHVMAYIWLDGAWLRCDPSDDKALSLGSRHLNPPSEVVQWDGLTDAVLNLRAEHILSEQGPQADLDAVMAKPMRLALRVPVRIANLYLDFLRDEGANAASLVEAERAFRIWLRKWHPVMHVLYASLPERPATAPVPATAILPVAPVAPIAQQEQTW